MDETGEVVMPNVPHFLGAKDPGTNRLTRLDLARWMVSEQNPLTARVFVNRLWKQFFGTGLSKVLDDLGAQGEWPTHPELLDWLAAEFMRPGVPDVHPSPTLLRQRRAAWDIKHMVRLIVLSATYKEASTSTLSLIHI